MIQVLTFDTTHEALLAEQIALEQGFAVQPVPAPPEAGASCDLALEFFEEDRDALTAALSNAGVRHTVFTR